MAWSNFYCEYSPAHRDLLKAVRRAYERLEFKPPIKEPEMNTREKLQARIEQNEIDRQKLIDEGKILVDKLQALDEPTYSIGDRFMSSDGDKYLMTQVNNKVGMVGLNCGHEYGTGFILVLDHLRVTRTEFLRMGYSLDICITRYWDSRRKVYTDGRKA